MPEDNPLRAFHDRLIAEAAEEEFPIDEQAARDLHVGLMEALYYRDVLFAKSADRDRASSHQALHTVIRFLQAHEKWRDASRPLVILESSLHDLEFGHVAVMLRHRNVGGGNPVSWYQTMHRGHAAGIVGGLMKYARMPRNQAAERVSKKLSDAGYRVAPSTIIDWRQDALDSKKNPILHDAYRTIIDKADWSEPLACAEQLIAKLISLYPQKEG